MGPFKENFISSTSTWRCSFLDILAIFYKMKPGISGES